LFCREYGEPDLQNSYSRQTVRKSAVETRMRLFNAAPSLSSQSTAKVFLKREATPVFDVRIKWTGANSRKEIRNSGTLPYLLVSRSRVDFGKKQALTRGENTDGRQVFGTA
jgi:hypothetical protein